MNERRERGGHSVLPFLLIPATVMMVKAMHRHRAMRTHGWGPGAYGPGFGHRAWTAASDEAAAGAEGRPAFRLPPMIEAHLNAWHEQAHKASESAEPGEGATA
jgi:hypothetical protein